MCVIHKSAVTKKRQSKNDHNDKTNVLLQCCPVLQKNLVHKENRIIAEGETEGERENEKQ